MEKDEFENVAAAEAGCTGFESSDERILGDSDFVIHVLKAANQSLEEKYGIEAKRYDLIAP
jgi:hypothetical protein